jgi:hypothetical protein
MISPLAWTREQLLNLYREKPRRVSRQDYDSWRRTVIWDCLQGQRVGQSFCNKFDIHDFWLYNTLDSHMADRHIRRYYLKRSAKNSQ